MAETIDTNLLLHASNEDSPHHGAARALIDRLAAGPELILLFWPTILGYLRIATHPRIFPSPLTHSHAVANIGSLLSRPHIRAAGEGEGFWDFYLRTTEGLSPRGNLIPDAHLTALMHQYSISTIWSSDRDFRKFDGINQLDPFT